MIIIKNDKEIDLMRKAGKIVAETLLVVEKNIKPGITTAELDRIAEEFITKHGAKPSFKGLYGFPASLCISVNEQVVHGIPGRYVLKEGDIVSVDCGAMIDGYHGAAKVGNNLTDISNEIQTYIEASGFSVVRDFVGHGIGKDLHEDPEVPNFGRPGRGPKLVTGMALAIEPMVNVGSHRVKTLGDDWTVITSDKSLSAHYENTVIILPDGPEILTLVK